MADRDEWVPKSIDDPYYDDWAKAHQVQEQSRPTNPKTVRQFDTGATRDSDENKHEYAGFNSPLVEKRFAEYMTSHRKQSDGKLRSSSNWKKGIPKDAYLQSLHRHFIDLWLHLDGFPEAAVDTDIESVLCAIRFNTNGMLHELLKEKYVQDTAEKTSGK